MLGSDSYIYIYDSYDICVFILFRTTSLDPESSANDPESLPQTGGRSPLLIPSSHLVLVLTASSASFMAKLILFGFSHQSSSVLAGVQNITSSRSFMRMNHLTSIPSCVVLRSPLKVRAPPRYVYQGSPILRRARAPPRRTGLTSTHNQDEVRCDRTESAKQKAKSPLNRTLSTWD